MSKIVEKQLRFDPQSAEDLTVEEVVFGKAMRDYMTRYDIASLTCGEILDAAMQLGYAGEETDFEKAVMELTFAMKVYRKKHRRLFPAWSEVLKVITDLGYRKTR